METEKKTLFTKFKSIVDPVNTSRSAHWTVHALRDCDNGEAPKSRHLESSGLETTTTISSSQAAGFLP